MSQILFVSPAAFDALHQRHQSLAIELTKRDQSVIFLDPVRTGGYRRKTRKVADNLEVVQLQVPFKSVSHPAIQKLTVRFAMLLLREKCKIIPASTILWISEPSLAWLTRHRWQTIIYDRCDLHGSFPGQRKEAWQKYEKLLFARAGLISCSHPHLQNTLPESARNKSVLAGNASADLFFGKIRDTAVGDGRLKLVSAGAHHEWVDTSWLKMLATHAGVELHLAGTGRGKGYEDLKQQPGIIDHGRLNQSELARLLKTCDIGLVPFCDIELIRGVDPVKVYEYAASGLEVWAPPVASLRTNTLINRFIATPDDLDLAIADSATQKRQPAPAVARWSERLQTILDRLDDLQSD
ncbi:MAG: hypothetical protein GQF41_4339 [Candidatus Rifleibacterium amylolyticum]|nr:MAG: hypothetical protein GQF41_4339 [Candidatus Rifleibacterium amylolyticum]